MESLPFPTSSPPGVHLVNAYKRHAWAGPHGHQGSEFGADGLPCHLRNKMKNEYLKLRIGIG